MTVREELKQPAGLVHGGVYASIAESMASLATALAVCRGGNMAMGLSNNTSFLRPITAGTCTPRRRASIAGARRGYGTCASATTTATRAR